MLPNCTRDLWEYLQETNKTIVLYGMGNGADKILSVLAEREIPVRGVFASDGFARGNLFHGMPVRTWSEVKAEFGAENIIVLLAFGTSRHEVLENILSIRSEAELYAPDVPVFGDTLFTRAFYEEHIEDFIAAYAPYVRHAHLKDVTIISKEDRPIGKNEFYTVNKNYMAGAVWGQGDVNMEAGVKALQKAGYTGYYAIESDPSTEEDPDFFEKNLAYADTLLTRLGVE